MVLKMNRGRWVNGILLCKNKQRAMSVFKNEPRDKCVCKNESRGDECL